MVKGVIKVLMNSRFMFRHATYINQVFNVNYQQFNCHLHRIVSKTHNCAVPLQQLLPPLLLNKDPRNIHICSRATPEVQEVKVLHDATGADFNYRLLMGVRTIRRRTIRRGQFGADNSARTIRRWTIRRNNLSRTIRRKI